MSTDSPFRLNEATQRYTAVRSLSCEEILEQAREIITERFVPGLVLTSTRAANEFLVLRFAELPHEVFGVIFLDNRHRLITFEEMFRGTIDGASVYPREVVKAALAHNAAAVILAHCHPSGVPEPSGADRRLTERLRDALGLVDIRVLDHLIVGGDQVTSFAERGLL